MNSQSGKQLQFEAETCLIASKNLGVSTRLGENEYGIIASMNAEQNIFLLPACSAIIVRPLREIPARIISFPLFGDDLKWL